MNIVVPMSGLGSRFRNIGIEIPKPLIVVEGRHIVEHAVDSLGIEGQYIFITKKYDKKEYNTSWSTFTIHGINLKQNLLFFELLRLPAIQ